MELDAGQRTPAGTPTTPPRFHTPIAARSPIAVARTPNASSSLFSRSRTPLQQQVDWLRYYYKINFIICYLIFIIHNQKSSAVRPLSRGHGTAALAVCMMSTNVV